MTRIQTMLGKSHSGDYGLLFIRIGLGAMFLWHGYPKIAGGPEGWEELGESMKYFGIDFFPLLWGFLGAVGEFIGALLLIVGLRFQLACLMLAATMFVAAVSHFGAGEGMFGASNAIEDAIVFVGLIFIGPGKLSIDKAG
jgi:putative oxidoreductase